MFPDALLAQATDVLNRYREKGCKLVTAESCTGGLIAGLLTEIPGSSAVLERGFVTYSNEAKTTMLGVEEELIERVGAVSEEVAIAMAEGALRYSAADVSIAVTGIAGPGGGSLSKPVGLVYIAYASRFITHHKRCLFSGDRQEVRLSAVQEALIML